MASSIAELRERSLRKLKTRTAPQLSFETAALFLKNFLQHPFMLGSAIPSSRYLISRVLDKVAWNSVDSCVEYGPGVGTFTSPMLQRMKPGARLLAIELNHEFAGLLRGRLADPRLRIAHGSAVDVTTWMRRHHLPSADFILSGIPYTVLPTALRRRILTATRDALSPNGIFAVYQYTRAVLPDLQQVFGEVEEDFEPLNILPARIYICRK